MNEQPLACAYCGINENEVPLVVLRYNGREYAICSQHLPILIHKPAALTGHLPGVENLQSGEHD